MQNFIKTIISSIQNWTNKQIKKQIKGSTADWNQNDSTADSYIKNRTHWEETKKVVLVDNLTFNDYDNGNAPQCNFNVGQKYIITWNGRVYETTCYSDGEWRIIADRRLGCPFYIDDDGGDNLFIRPDDGKTDWIVSITTIQPTVHKLDSKYLNLPENIATIDDVQGVLSAEEQARIEADATKMDKENPVGTGSFSMNRKANTSIGDYSFVIGNNTATNSRSRFVSGEYNANISTYKQISSLHHYSANILVPKASGHYTYCSDNYTFDEESGIYTLLNPQLVSNDISTISGLTGKYFVKDGYGLKEDGFSGSDLVSPLADTTVKSHNSNYHEMSTLDWYYRTPDKSTNLRGKYVHIVGNGTSDTERSNAHTLDWNGVGWYAGGLQVGGNAQDDGAKSVLLEGDALKIESIKISLPASIAWSSVTHGNGKFVAIAGGGGTKTKIAAYSADGLSWSQTTLPILASWRAVTYGDDKFVAVGETNICAYSNDGITWTQVAFPETDSNSINTYFWHDIAYGNGKFVVTSSGGEIAYSEDGLAWTKVNKSAHPSGALQLAYGNGKFIAADGNIVYYSTDGINWTGNSELYSVSGGLYAWDVTYGNGKFVAAGTNHYTHTDDVAAYSEDGITWTKSPQSAASVFHKNGSRKLLANDGAGKFVVFCEYATNFAAYSEDGINWLETTLPITADWSSLTYGNGKFVAISRAPKVTGAAGNDIVIESTDGINWRDSHDVITQNNKDRADDLKSLILGEPSRLDRIEAQITYTAIMTDTLLEV